MLGKLNKEDCCGCRACVQKCPKHCISMIEDDEGFSYPIIDKILCINCGMCEKVCPYMNQNSKREPIQILAGKNNDEQIRRRSSSGGIFTALAQYVLSVGGLIFGAKFNDEWEVVHDYTNKIEDLDFFRRSKYVQSNICDTFLKVEEFLKLGKLVLFTGTPCQIHGLNKFLRKEYENLITMDFICHGVPSPKVWRMYLEQLEGLDKKCITSISFRDKTEGWRKFSLKINVTNQEGKNGNSFLRESLLSNAYLKGFLANLYLRPSCHHCSSRNLRSGSDITIGDFWGEINTKKEFLDDKGASVILLNSEKGRVLFKSIKENIYTEELDYDTVLKSNPSLESSCKVSKLKVKFYEELNKNRIDETISKLLKPSLLISLKQYIKKSLYK